METVRVHTLIIGSGAAGLSAAIHLHRSGITDLLIATEALQGGTSINTGSDKQTYYKLSLCGADADSVRDMAETYFAGGSMHGDLALAEAANSVRAFMNLTELGLPFPADEYGQFVGYKTDHDPRQRATSIGPYTSREMCRAMIREVQRLGIPVRENVFVRELLVQYDPPAPNSVELPVTGEVYGTEFYVMENGSEAGILRVLAENVIFAVGGPGGLYQTSVYPTVHTGAIGVALQAGAVAQNLPESQFGLASIGFRWNVSGTYMQCIPRFVSTASDGSSDPREFMEEYAHHPGELLPLVFLKGYQWPFDSRKTQLHDGIVRNFGSSMIDIWVYVETVLRGRRVWLDFRKDPVGLSRENLGPESWNYLEKSGASALETPIARLEKMNPAAIEMYADHGIDIRSEMLEIAVCAQHNNGGLAGDVNWESVNLRRLFPIGEVNGSHGVYRPGGSALNSGQVGALRAAQTVAKRSRNGSDQDRTAKDRPAKAAKTAVLGENFLPDPNWQVKRRELQQRMTASGGFLRKKDLVERALSEVRRERSLSLPPSCMESQRNSWLLLTQEIYLDAIRFQLDSEVGSRGSAITLKEGADGSAHVSEDVSVSRLDLNGEWTEIVPENEDFRNFVQETWLAPDGTIRHRWVPRRPIPEPDSWFENVWRKNREA